MPSGPSVSRGACQDWSGVAASNTLPDSAPDSGVLAAVVTPGTVMSECFVVVPELHLVLVYGNPAYVFPVDTAIYSLTVCNRCQEEATMSWLGERNSDRWETSDDTLARFAFSPLFDRLKLAPQVSSEGVALSVVLESEDGSRSRPLGAPTACDGEVTAPEPHPGADLVTVPLSAGESVTFLRPIREGSVAVLADARLRGLGSLNPGDITNGHARLRYQAPLISNDWESFGATYPMRNAMVAAGLQPPSPCMDVLGVLEQGDQRLDLAAPVQGFDAFVRF
jgi:hypothetical protein